MRELISQKMRDLSPELDPLRLGTGWKMEDLSKPQIIVESTFGDSHPGSGHLDQLVKAACHGIAHEYGLEVNPLHPNDEAVMGGASA